MPSLTFVTGGARSGKSRFALELACAYKLKVFAATAEPFDDEMRFRIRKHQEERERLGFTTIEEPLNLADALRRAPSGTEVILVDCLTVWLGNMLHHHGVSVELYPEEEAFLRVLSQPPCDMIIVTNETGLGIVPIDSMSRAFRDHAGRMNQNVAAIASTAYFVVSGIPMKLKG